MARLPVATRQLSERRARLAGEIPRLERLLEEVSTRLATARAELAAVDLILPTFDDRVDPSQIAPIAARRSLRGKRGAFKNEVLAMLAAAAPGGLSTTEMSMKLRQTFEYDLPTQDAVKRWNDNVLRAQLKRLAKEGVIERVKLTDVHSDDAYWRMAHESATSLEQLRRQVAPNDT